MNDNNMMMIIPRAVFPVLFSILLFGYIMKPEMAVFMHSLPVTRKELFLKKTCAGILLIVIPVIVFTSILFLLKGSSNELANLSSGGFSVFLPEDILLWALGIISVQMVLFAAGTFAAQLTGRSPAQLGLAMIIILLPLGFLDALDMNLDILLRGYRIGSIFGLVREINRYVEPFRFLIYGLLAVIMLFLAYALYKNRRTESTGNIFVFKHLHMLSILLITFIGMLISGAVMGVIIGRKSFAIYLGYIISVFTVAVFSNIIYKRYADGGIPNKKQRYLSISIFLAVVLGLATAVQFHFNAVPSVESIESVEISGNNVILDLYTSSGIRNGNRFSSREALENITEIHQKIVQAGGNESGSETYRFDYKFKDGREMTRLFESPDCEELIEIQKKIILSDEFRDKLKMMLSYEASWINVHFNENNEYFRIYDELEIKKIMKAILDDYVSLKEADLNDLENTGYINFQFSNIKNEKLSEDPFDFDLTVNIYDFCRGYMDVVNFES